MFGIRQFLLYWFMVSGLKIWNLKLDRDLSTLENDLERTPSKSRERLRSSLIKFRKVVRKSLGRTKRTMEIAE